MKAQWKIGDEARIATYNDCKWVLILEMTTAPHSIVTTLGERGEIGYWEIGSLETRESYLHSCERMRDEWTGAHYRKMVELADRPFVKHPDWEKWVERATGRTDARLKLDKIYSRWDTPPSEQAYFRKETLRRVGLTEEEAVARIASGEINPVQLQTDIAHCFG